MTPSPGVAFAAAGRLSPADLEDVDLLERALVEQQVKPLPGGELAALVLDVDALFAAAGVGVLAQLEELEDVAVHDLDHERLLVVCCGFRSLSLPGAGLVRTPCVERK